MRALKYRKFMKEIGIGLGIRVLNIAKKLGGTKYQKMKDKLSESTPFGKISNKFTIDHIMNSIDVEKTKMLFEKFKKKQKEVEEGFTLIEFVELMKSVVPYNHPNEECDLVLGLCNLFKEIDINGNGGMEWDEFTGFLVETVNQRQL